MKTKTQRRPLRQAVAEASPLREYTRGDSSTATYRDHVAGWDAMKGRRVIRPDGVLGTVGDFWVRDTDTTLSAKSVGIRWDDGETVRYHPTDAGDFLLLD